MNTANCTFCGKSRDEVRKLIAGRRVYICDECILLCVDILQEDGIVVGELTYVNEHGNAP